MILKQQTRKMSNLKNNVRMVKNCCACANYKNGKCLLFINQKKENDTLSLSFSKSHPNVEDIRNDQSKCGIEGKYFKHNNIDNTVISYGLMLNLLSSASLGVLSFMPHHQNSAFLCIYVLSSTSVIGLASYLLHRNSIDNYIEYDETIKSHNFQKF
jgi:hypothetical protein